MKASLFILLCLLYLCHSALRAQNPQETSCANCPQYDAFMEKGKGFLKARVFDKALNEFQAAQIAARICNCGSNAPSGYILKVFKGIQQQKEAAVAALKRAEKAEKVAKAEKVKTQVALAETEKAKNEAQTALQKADKLIKAFYFFAGRFALAYGDKDGSNVFYFIDQNGDEVSKLGQWKKAEQFDERGFAKIKKDNAEEDYLLDTLGNSYLVAYDPKEMKPETRALDLGGKHLKKFPMEVFQHPQLQVLLLYSNAFDSLPPEIEELKNLTTLDLSENQLHSLPSEIGTLNNLTAFDLSLNQLSRLQPEIGELKNLTYLYLGGNQLSRLPPQIGELKNLTYLDLGFNQFSNLQPEIGELKNLTYLDLGGNQLSSLPPQIEELKNLNNLNLGDNQLSSLPPQIEKLKNLNNLNLGDNQLDSLPPQIGEFKNLTHLDLGSNQLSSLPPEIGALKNLTHLDLSSNQLSRLPPQIGELKNLTYLDLSANQLSRLPPQIGALKNLTSLGLSANQLSSLPPEIGALKNLIYLYLEENSITLKYVEPIKQLLPKCNIGGFGDAELSKKYFDEKNYLKANLYIKKSLEKDSLNASNWFNMSFYALFTNEPRTAIYAAKKTLELSPDELSVETNLALGYLLNDQWPEAEKIYLKWKGQKFPNREELCDELFLKDIQDLEAAGITHPDFEKVKQFFKK